MTMKSTLLVVGIFLPVIWALARESHPASAAVTRTPVLVELFTSEGCSSCPPADRLLEKFDRQPVPGAEIVVLSEHVDYWNHIGWKDPYSARSYSERQSAYGRRFDLDSVYTPQMVVDGTSEFVGSDAGLADKAFAKALAAPKLPLRLAVMSNNSESIRVHVDTGTLTPSFGPPEAEVYIAIALDRAESQVSSGENAGHRLEHVAVVRQIMRVGVLKQAQAFSQDVELKLGTGLDHSNLRLIAFVQEPRQGRVLGTALLPRTAIFPINR